jgi:hypothetical protein
MGKVKGAAITAAIVVAVLVALHYVGPAALKQHTGTV